MIQTLPTTADIIDDLCGLLHAAGPLAARDIAAGLNLPMRDVSMCLTAMTAFGDLAQDEFGRFRLVGACPGD